MVDGELGRLVEELGTWKVGSGKLGLRSGIRRSLSVTT